MIILKIRSNKYTFINKNVNIHISKRFYPRGTRILLPNIMLNKKKMMLPNALLRSFTPRTTTHLFVYPKNNVNFQKSSYKYPFNENNSNQNISLSEKIRLLPLKDPNEKFTSGLMSLSPQEYLYLKIKNQSIEAIQYKTTIKTQLTKILYLLFGTDQNIPLKKKFEWIFDVEGIPLTNMPNLLHNKKFITLYQHLLTFICYDKVISYETLKDFAFPLNCESYQGQKINAGALVEAFIIKKNLLFSYIDKPFEQYYLVNPNNLHPIPGYLNQESMEQTGQRNADLMIRKPDVKIYADVKTYSSAGFFEKNLLSIMFLDKKELLKQINNIKVSLQALIKDTIDNTHKTFLNEKLEIISKIRLEKVSDQIKAQKLHKFLLNIQKSAFYADTRVSLNFALEGTETAENPFQIVLNNVVKRLEQQFPNDNLEIMFPSTTSIDNKKRLEFLEDFVQNHFQDNPELLERVLSNMKSPLYLNAN